MIPRGFTAALVKFYRTKNISSIFVLLSITGFTQKNNRSQGIIFIPVTVDCIINKSIFLNIVSYVNGKII